MPIGDWIADPIAGHSHEIAIPLDPERALAHALSVPVAPDRTVRTLFRLRGLNPTGSLESFFSSPGPGFKVLDRTPTEFTSGIAARIWPPRGEHPLLRDAADWDDWDEVPGAIKAVGTFRTRGGDGDWSQLETETRVSASDREAARAFRVYWLAVGPASSMIRRRWLRAMASRARAVSVR
jgi:hypothetical protein